MLSTSQKRKALWMHLRGFEERQVARKTHSTCQETIVRGTKCGRAAKHVALQNEPLDALKTMEDKSRRYWKKIQQNTWKTESWSIRNSWVQAKRFSKWRHYENAPRNSARKNQPKLLESLQKLKYQYFSTSRWHKFNVDQKNRERFTPYDCYLETVTDLCIENHGQETAMIIMMNSKPKQKKTIARSN